MEDFTLFNRDAEAVTEELNKRRWLPFISKERVLRLITSLSNRWAELYRTNRIEDNKNVLTRMQELDKAYQERDEYRMQLLVEKLETFKKSVIRQSQNAFCMGVCKEIASLRGKGVNCSCGRRVRYMKRLEETIAPIVEEEANRLIKEFQEGPKWKEKKDVK